MEIVVVGGIQWRNEGDMNYLENAVRAVELQWDIGALETDILPQECH